jgi:hypothetical protein
MLEDLAQRVALMIIEVALAATAMTSMLLSAPPPRAELRHSVEDLLPRPAAPASDWPFGTLAAEEPDRWLSGRWR